MRLVLGLLMAVVVMLPPELYAVSNGQVDYKEKYEKQVNINRGMVATDAMILVWFKNHEEYKKYSSIKKRVDELYRILKKAKEAHFKSLTYKKNKDFKNAYKWAKKEWEYLNSIAVKGKKVQENLKELESE